MYIVYTDGSKNAPFYTHVNLYVVWKNPSSSNSSRSKGVKVLEHPNRFGGGPGQNDPSMCTILVLAYHSMVITGPIYIQ